MIKSYGELGNKTYIVHYEILKEDFETELKGDYYICVLKHNNIFWSVGVSKFLGFKIEPKRMECLKLYPEGKYHRKPLENKVKTI